MCLCVFTDLNKTSKYSGGRCHLYSIEVSRYDIHLLGHICAIDNKEICIRAESLCYTTNHNTEDGKRAYDTLQIIYHLRICLDVKR